MGEEVRRVVVLLLFLVACSQPVVESCERPLMGFAFYPGAVISEDPQAFVSSYSDTADLMLLHFGDKVPWTVLRECADVDSCASGELKATLDQLSLHAKNFPGNVFVAISPLNNDRDGVATDWDGSAVFDDFSGDEVHALYKHWADYVQKKFSPDFFAQGVEVNMYAKSNPEDFDNLVRLLQSTKSSSLGPTIQWEFYKDMWLNGDRATLEAVDWSSLGPGLALSTYPEILDVPTGYSVADFGLTMRKPFFISEAGIQSSKQAALLAELMALNPDGLVWFFKENDNKLLDQLPNEYPHTIFKDAGMQSSEWKDYFTCVN